MKYPNFNEEKKLWRQGFNFVVGLDESGRGPLAGPVVAAAIMILNPKHEIRNPKQILNNKISKHISNFDIRISSLGIKDSKQLSVVRREEFYEILTRHPAVGWGVGIVSEKIIDKINILEATKLAMQKAVNDLDLKIYKSISTPKIDDRLFLGHASFLLLDGNFSLQTKISQKSVIKGDQKVFSISAASIIAKVTRDRIMQKMHKKYPKYRFDLHKGYGTALHVANLQKFGPSKIHRKTFFPVSKTN